jgi:hypothetical protein
MYRREIKIWDFKRHTTWHCTQTLPRRNLPRYMHKRNFIYTHTKSTAFPLPIFTKIINVQQHYVNISSCNEFHQTWKINVERINIHLRPTTSKAFTASILAKIFITTYIFVDTNCTEFKRNRSEIVENTSKISFTPLSTADLLTFLFYRVRTIKLKIFCPVLGYVNSFFICKP